ncbi:MAG: TonB-dependent receptor, partial [Ferruginibacter sp.]|nr:TonB-dependent receptor [Ferruginibacter sp.]
MDKILLFFVCFISSSIMAQNIEGRVYDNDTKEPVAGAVLQVVSSSKNTISNSEGRFVLKGIKPSDTIHVHFIGYTDVFLPVRDKMAIPLKPNINELQNIVVTANREAGIRTQIPVAISRLSPRLINETKANQVYEIINKTPGVIMPSYNNEQHGMSIRQPMGTSAYYLYMEDGLPIRPLGIFNHNALLEVNQFAISSIEVIKGPVSSIYGPEAVGGTINFITQKPTSVPTAKIGVQADNWGFRRVQFGAGGQIKKFGFYIAGLSSRQVNSWMTSSDYDKTSLNLRLEYSFSEKTRLTGTLIYGKYFSQMSGSVDGTAFYNRQYISASYFTYRKSDAYRSRI